MRTANETAQAESGSDSNPDLPNPRFLRSSTVNPESVPAACRPGSGRRSSICESSRGQDDAPGARAALGVRVAGLSQSDGVFLPRDGDVHDSGGRLYSILRVLQRDDRPAVRSTIRGRAAGVAETARRLGLKHVVVTSVTRDDLADGGAHQFAETIRELRAALPDAAVEVLTPDFRGNTEAVRTVVEAGRTISTTTSRRSPASTTMCAPARDSSAPSRSCVRQEMDRSP